MTALERIFGDPQGRNASVTWQPNPQGRGTMAILWTCLLTMSLCVWTALHLNVPSPEPEDRFKLRKTVRIILGTGRWFKGRKAPELDSAEVLEWARVARTFLRKVIWLLLGMFAPEIVVYAATTQFLAARNAECTELSATQKFFVAMGGVAIVPDSTTPYTTGMHLQFLSQKAIKTVQIYDKKLLLHIADHNIKDKSKTSALAQTIVCTQALWFMVQCISRFAQPLPITLLELNTFAHCLCALMVYILWWRKPLDVMEPILLQGETAQELLAYFTIRNQDGHVCGRLQPKLPNGPKHEDSAPEAAAPQSSPPSQHDVVLKVGDQLLDTGLYLTSSQYGGDITLNGNQIERWKRATPVVHRLGLRDIMIQQRTPGAWNISLEAPPNMPDDELTSENDGRFATPILIASGFVYGGLHALAWNAPFRNTVEQLLWRISSIVIMSYGSLYIIIMRFALNRSFSDLNSGSDFVSVFKEVFFYFVGLFLNPTDIWRYNFKEYLPVVFLTLLNVAFLFSRAYLVWESFFGLFHAVPGVFSTPKWSVHFPHIG